MHTKPTPKPAIVQCAWCRRIKLDGRWIALKWSGTLVDPINSGTISHGICEDCARVQMQELINNTP